MHLLGQNILRMRDIKFLSHSYSLLEICSWLDLYCPGADKRQWNTVGDKEAFQQQMQTLLAVYLLLWVY